MGSPDFKSISEESFSIKDKEILTKIKKFYSSHKKYIHTVTNIIVGESDICIRLIDWFVSNYSKKYNTSYRLNNSTIFYVNKEYKNQLNGYSKKYFDPFCRKKKIIISLHQYQK